MIGSIGAFKGRKLPREGRKEASKISQEGVMTTTNLMNAGLMSRDLHWPSYKLYSLLHFAVVSWIVNTCPENYLRKS